MTKQLEDCQTSLQELRSALKATESKAAGLRKERDDTVAGLQNKIQKLEQGQKSNAAAAQAVSDELRITKESLARLEKEKVILLSCFHPAVLITNSRMYVCLHV